MRYDVFLYSYTCIPTCGGSRSQEAGIPPAGSGFATLTTKTEPPREHRRNYRRTTMVTAPPAPRL